MEELYINRIKLLLLAFLVLTLSSIIGAAIEVHPGQSIQAAVDNANPQGDTIIVHPGTYTENIAIAKANNLVLMSASGNPDDTIIVPNAVNKSVISATNKMNLVIKGFTISGAANDTSGIRLESCRDCTIENNKFLNDGMGVYVLSCINTKVRNNAVTRTSEAGKVGRGINIEKSDKTTASSNTVSNHTYGMYFSESTNNIISENTVSQSTLNGIVLERGSTKSALESNTVSSSGNKGIYLKESGTSSLKNNIASSNRGNGIDLELSSGSTVLNNIISGFANNTNIHGLFLNTCKDVYLQNNTISNCQYGVAIRYSENNKFVSNNAYDNDRGFYVSYTSSGNTLSGNKANSNNNGIIVERGANNNTLENNEASKNSASGISLDNAISNTRSNNDASSNYRGIYLLSLSSKNILSGNTVNSNSNNGIVLENTSENNITSNIANSNGRYGIYVASSNNSYLASNTVQNNVRGISLLSSASNTISKNIATDCNESGLFLSLCSNNIFSKNIAYNNKEGITIDSSPNNEISGNNISLNSNGIYMCPRSTENKVYDNYFNNMNNANIRNNRGVWNIEKIDGRNVMGGKYLGGNFWGSPALMGFSDDESNPIDSNEDGIIDIPFVSENGIKVSANGNITDNYPLKRVPVPVVNFKADTTKGFAPLTVQFMDLSQDATSRSWDFGDGNTSTVQNPMHTFSGVGTYTVTLTASNKYGTADPKAMQIIVQKYTILPVADFSASVTSGNAPLNVQFTDLSQYAKLWSWNFGDGSTSTDQNATHTYSTAGTYTVSLNAINENGTSLTPKTATITVTQESSSSSSSGGSSSGGSSSGGSSSGGSSSGGGGAGSSPEAAKNVEVKEISQAFITNGKTVNFDFAREATCVVSVNFDAKKTAGKTNAIAEQLKGKSTLVSDLNAGEVYKYFNVWVGTGGVASSKNIENPVVCFRVDKSWLQDKNIDQASITLSRCNDKKWSQLPTKLLKEDGKYLYFTAETPEFSFFAITGKAAEKEIVTEIKPETGTSKTEQNDVKSEVEKEQKTEQNTSQGKTSSIPGFETVYVVACLLMVFLYRRK
jgi:PGF-pre-PGF domain-containing protein